MFVYVLHKIGGSWIWCENMPKYSWENPKEKERHLLLDLLNALYTKADFASCSRSGKKGKSVETAKPELDTNKQKAIVGKSVYKN